MKKGFVIAAPWSNSGKTTVTLGLARYFSNKGMAVQTFKCGPDYIDTLHHGTAARKPSVNLDSIMMSDTHLKSVFNTHSQEAEIAIVEGVMGLFDGAVKAKGSSAEIAKKLQLPIILVVNAKAMAHTIAPILYGLKTFDTEVKIAGVVFNFVKTASHYAFLKEACETVGIKALGYLSPNEKIKIPSRHLGLYIEHDFENLIENAAIHVAKLAEKLMDLETLDSNEISNIKKKEPVKGTLKIAVAKDEAFSFTYLENLHYLERLGEIMFFSPIHDKKLPKADIIYLAGGYPELYLNDLEVNTSMRKAIKKAAESDVKIIAECGGMMYLGASIVNENGEAFSMANVFNFTTSMQAKKLHLGYRKIQVNEEVLWGHEFHYSTLQENTPHTSIGKIHTARGKEIATKIYTYKNVIASYIHFYWAEVAQNSFLFKNNSN